MVGFLCSDNKSGVSIRAGKAPGFKVELGKVCAKAGEGCWV